ncbi:hypothetical protein PWT90_00634 [Aphanocladium album]|nr:hypothetical protein PWT90_00634 [Aphanocladium album]
MSETPSDAIEDALESLITTYGELNGCVIEELDCEPSPLEFMRFVARNTPFVVRGGATSWKAYQKWDKDYLVNTLAGQSVNVAITPHGNADAPTVSAAHNSLLFAKPHEESQPFEEFLNYIIGQEHDAGFGQDAEVRYAQTRNSRSVTATHKDNFENIYVQIRGRKHFVLLSPLHHHCMNEKLLPPATYVRSQEGELWLCLDQDATPIPFVTWDPDYPDRNCVSLSRFARPVRVTLEPGDMLYLPAMWYHKVTQSVADNDPNGFVVAVNYWYDMNFTGPLFPTAAFLREVKI